MPAITKRRDGRYQAALQVNGIRRFVYGKTKREVAEKLAHLQRQAGGGSLPAPGRRTVADLFAAALATLSPTLKPSTIADYEEVAARHILPLLGRIPLARLSPAQLQQCYARLLAEGRSRTAAKVHRVCHRVFQLGVLWRWLAENPADYVVPPAYQAPRREVWSLAELHSFLRATRDDWLYPLWVVITATGARLGEVLALRWSDVDWERRTIALRRSVQRIRGEWVETLPKTKSGERVVSLPAEAVAALRRQRVQQAEWRLRAGMGWHDRGLIFTNRHGDYLWPGVVQHSLARWCARLGLRKLTPHGLRHLHASLLLRNGIDVARVSARLGHASPSITMAVYAHCVGNQDDEAAQIIGRALR